MKLEKETIKRLIHLCSGLVFKYSLLRRSFEHFLHALDEGAERFNLCPKEQVSKLGIGKEYDEEHDGETQDIFSTSTQC